MTLADRNTPSTPSPDAAAGGGGTLAPIPGAIGYYADAEGYIWSEWFGGGKKNGPFADLWRMRQRTSASGYYPCVRLTGTGRGQQSVHRLVLEAFHGPCPPGCEASHLDDDGWNNRPGNLTWESHKENVGRRAPMRGEGHPSSRLSEDDVRTIKALVADGLCTQAECARLYGVQPPCISRICNGKRWGHVT